MYTLYIFTYKRVHARFVSYIPREIKLFINIFIIRFERLDVWAQRGQTNNKDAYECVITFSLKIARHFSATVGPYGKIGCCPAIRDCITDYLKIYYSL